MSPVKECTKQIINIKTTTNQQQKRLHEQVSVTKKGQTGFVQDPAELSMQNDEQVYNYDSDDSYERIKDLARTTKNISNEHFNSTFQPGLANMTLRSETNFDELLNQCV